jgi:hypothetical protein
LAGAALARFKSLSSAAKAAVLCLVPLAFSYHRQYDAVLILPSLAVAGLFWMSGHMIESALLAIAFAGALFAIGEHSPAAWVDARLWHSSPPPYLPSLAIVSLLIVLFLTIFLVERPKFSTSASPPIPELAKL